MTEEKTARKPSTRKAGTHPSGVAEDQPAAQGKASAASVPTGTRSKTANNVDVLVVARYGTAAQAAHMYDELSDEQSTGKVSLDGLVVVAADDNGKIHVEKLVDHSTKTGFSLGLVGALVAGAFFPATMLAGGIALGLGGAGIGKARNAARRRAIDRELTDILKPGTSGLVCLTDTFRAIRLKRKMRGAQEVRTIAIDEETAAALRAAKPVS